MTIGCPGCGITIQVPEERAANPLLKVKCRCGAVFALADAPRVAATPSVPAPTAAAAVAIPAAPVVRPAVPPSVVAPAAPPPGPVIAAGAETAPVPPRPASPKPPPVAPVAAKPASTPAPSRPRAGDWRRCANHRQVRPAHVCPACQLGYCNDCTQKVQQAAICPACEGLCVAAAEWEEKQERARQRARPMKDDLGLIAKYPLVDPIAYLMLSIFVGFFNLFRGNLYAGLFTKGVLMAYAFSALSKVSGGNLKKYMPEIDDITSLAQPLRLGFIAFLASAWPVIALQFWHPEASLFGSKHAATELTLAVAHAQEAPQEAAPQEAPQEAPPQFGETPAPGQPGAAASPGLPPGFEARQGVPEGTPFYVTLLLVVAYAWRLLYQPVALTIAAISRSIFETLNPLYGFGAIHRMGRVYWEAAAIYGVVSIVQLVIGFPFRFIPIAGGFGEAFVDAYAYLVIGCTLGLAVFKKAPELGFE